MRGRRGRYYLAHPVRGDVALNVQRTLAWLRFCHAALPHLDVRAPWVADVLAYADLQEAGPEREAGLARDCRDLETFDGIIIVGGEATARSSGVARERATVERLGRRIVDWTHLGPKPPELTNGVCPLELAEVWAYWRRITQHGADA